MMRDGATALAQSQSETIIEVKLPGRSYPIVIGEGLVASAGRRIAARASRRALRGGQRPQCGGALSRPAEGKPRSRRPVSRRGHRQPRRGKQELPRAGAAVREPARAWRRARRLRRRARRRRGRRSRRLCRQHPAARRALRADADLAAGAGGFLGRRQDRHRHAARQESDRRLPSAEPGARRHRHALRP